VWDLFGQALETFYYQGSCPPFYWQCDDGSSQEESIAFYFASFQDWNLQELAALDFITGRVLDIGCGAGKHALELQQRGLFTVGIDISPGALRVSKLRGVYDVRSMNIFTLNFPIDSFDCAILLTNNLSLGGTPSGVSYLLTELKRILSPDGKIVLTNLDVTCTVLQMHQDYQENNRKAGRLPGAIRMRAKYDGQFGEWIDWLFISPTELSQLAVSSGWYINKLKDFNGPYCAVLTRQD
jgi:SAM-dependent methyltransferase